MLLYAMKRFHSSAVAM